MSPTENDLRAALRDGEGDGPDASRIVIAGQRARARRRTQLVNTAVAVALVGGLGTAGSLLLGNTDGASHSSNDLGGAAKAPLLNGDGSGGGGGGAAAGGASAPVAGARSVQPSAATGAAIACPQAAPVLAAPPPANSTAPLFTTTPATLLVCTYATATGGTGGPAPVLLTGADARAVVRSLETAPTTRPRGMCPAYRIAGERTAEIIGRTASGEPAGVVTTTLDRPACATVVTNGKTVRYGWTPPPELSRRVGPLGGRSHGPVIQGTSPSR